MTPNQVTNLVFKYFLTLRNQHTSSDSILRLMLNNHYDEVTQTFEGSFGFVVRDYTYSDHTELYGHVVTSFHKTFRQTDVLDCTTNDMVVWHALFGADMFHKACKVVIRDFFEKETYDDCADDYFHGREPEINDMIDRPEPEVPVIAYANLLESGRIEVSWGFDRTKLTDKAKQNLIDMDGMDRLQYLLTGASKLREDRIERLKKYESEKQT